ncbi:MAG: hypothetical protein ACREDF_08260 [Thermoplasmata archaeon]
MKLSIIIVSVVLIIPLPILGQSDEQKKVEAALAERESRALTAAERVSVADDWARAAQRFQKEKARLWDRAVVCYERAWTDLDELGRNKLRAAALRAAAIPDDLARYRKGSASPLGWEAFSETAGSCIEEKAVFSGQRCGKMVRWTKENKAGNSWLTSLRFKVQLGKEYKFSARVFSDRADAPALLQLRFYDAAGDVLVQVGPTVDGDFPFWKRIEGVGKAPDGAVWADVCFWSRLTVGFFLIDDVSALTDGKEVITNGNFEKK